MTSASFALGDWSLPEGLGFWDVQSQAQLDHDNALYAKDKRDTEIEQKGTIRVATYGPNGWNSQLLSNQQFICSVLKKRASCKIRRPPRHPEAPGNPGLVLRPGKASRSFGFGDTCS